MAEKSAIERIKELVAERAKIFEQAKEEALHKANEAVADLNALGLHYHLAPGDETQVKAGDAKVHGTVKDAVCPVCGFKTSPPHDKRSHRAQKKKAPFTATELKKKGLEKL